MDDVGAKNPTVPRPAFGKLALFTALALGLAVYALSRDYFIGTDGAIYALLGDNLFAGRGYAIGGVPHTLFPPLYPLLIGLVHRLGVELELAAHVVSLAGFAAAMGLAFLLARQLTGRNDLSLLVAALFGFTAEMLSYAGQAMAEAPFAALVLAMALLAVRAGPWGWRRFLALGALGALAYLAKPEGLLYFLALLAYVALAIPQPTRTKAAGAAVALAVFAGLVAPWVSHLSQQAGGLALTGKLINRQIGFEKATGVTVGVYDAVTPEGDATYYEKPQAFHDAPPWSATLRLYPRWLGQQLKHLRSLVGNLALLLALFGLIQLRRIRRETILFCLLLLTPPLALAVFFADKRFWLPVLPIVYFLAAMGAVGAAALVAASTARQRLAEFPAVFRKGTRVAIAVVLAAAALLNGGAFAKAVRVDDSVRHRHAVRDWARQLRIQIPDLPGSSVLATRPWFAFYAGAQPRRLPVFDDPARLPDYLRRNRVAFVMIDEQQFPRIAERCRPLLAAPQDLGLTRAGAAAGAHLLRLE